MVAEINHAWKERERVEFRNRGGRRTERFLVAWGVKEEGRRNLGNKLVRSQGQASSYFALKIRVFACNFLDFRFCPFPPPSTNHPPIHLFMALNAN